MNDPRAQLCLPLIFRIRWLNFLLLIRIPQILFCNFIFEIIVAKQVVLSRPRSHTTRIKDHFRTLTSRYMYACVFLPYVMNVFLSTREWNAFVGTTITVVMIIRIFMPHVPRALWLPIRTRLRKIRSKTKFTQEVMNDLYTDPEFDLVGGYVHVTTTALFALIFGPTKPFLYALAGASFITRYLCDRWIFLRGCCRPPFYDEKIAYTASCWLLFGCAAGLFHMMHIFLTPPIVKLPEECLKPGFKTNGTIDQTRENEVKPLVNWIVWHFRSVSDKTVCSDRYTNPMALAFFCLIVAGTHKFWPRAASCKRKFLRRKKDDVGIIYDDCKAHREEVGLISSYDPRHNPRYQTAFKLLDLAAVDEDPSDDGKDDSTDSDSGNEEEEWVPKAGWDHAVKVISGVQPDEEEPKKDKKDKKEKKEKAQPKFKTMASTLGKKAGGTTKPEEVDSSNLKEKDEQLEHSPKEKKTSITTKASVGADQAGKKKDAKSEAEEAAEKKDKKEKNDKKEGKEVKKLLTSERASSGRRARGSRKVSSGAVSPSGSQSPTKKERQERHSGKPKE